MINFTDQKYKMILFSIHGTVLKLVMSYDFVMHFQQKKNDFVLHRKIIVTNTQNSPNLTNKFKLITT